VMLEERGEWPVTCSSVASISYAACRLITDDIRIYKAYTKVRPSADCLADRRPAFSLTLRLTDHNVPTLVLASVNRSRDIFVYVIRDYVLVLFGRKTRQSV
jgi:hypothetical protein